jgi:MFS family permease
MLWVWVMFSSLDLVRRNINRAVSDNLVSFVWKWGSASVRLTDDDGSLGTWASIRSKFPPLVTPNGWTAERDHSDYNTGQTIFLVCFLAAELPGGLLSKKIGPDRMTPIAICLWGVACAAQAAMKNRASFFALRAIIGFLQGGFIPEMVLYLSYYYKSNELPLRLSIFWTAIPLTQISGSLLAAGLLELRGVHNWAGWQWL